MQLLTFFFISIQMFVLLNDSNQLPRFNIGQNVCQLQSVKFNDVSIRVMQILPANNQFRQKLKRFRIAAELLDPFRVRHLLTTRQSVGKERWRAFLTFIACQNDWIFLFWIAKNRHVTECLQRLLKIRHRPQLRHDCTGIRFDRLQAHCGLLPERWFSESWERQT